MEQFLGSYNTVYQGGVGEIVMKKSRFISTVSPAETEEEALAFIKVKENIGITHNCYAYIIEQIIL